MTKTEPTELDERKEEIRRLKEELKAKNPEGGKVSKADALAYAKQKEDFEKMVQGFQAFTGLSLEVLNESLPRLLPNVFTPIPVSDSEKHVISEAFRVYMEQHAESFIAHAPGYMLAGSMVMFIAPRVQFKKKDPWHDTTSDPDHREDRDREEPLDTKTEGII